MIPPNDETPGPVQVHAPDVITNAVGWITTGNGSRTGPDRVVSHTPLAKNRCQRAGARRDRIIGESDRPGARCSFAALVVGVKRKSKHARM